MIDKRLEQMVGQILSGILANNQQMKGRKIGDVIDEAIGISKVVLEKMDQEFKKV